MIYTEIKYQPEQSKTYLGSPSIIRLTDGVLIASHDYFGSIKNLNNENGLTSIYRSEDDGKTWANITHIMDAFWGTLFTHNNVLYHISISQEYGNVVIRRSDDNGFTWTVPIDEKHGLLFKAAPHRQNPNYHFGGATCIFVHKRRIYKALEDFISIPNGPVWRPDLFQASVISVPEDADLLDASSWTMSNKLRFDYKQIDDESIAILGSGWLEGTITADPNDNVKMLMRVHLQQPNKAAIISVSDDGKKINFNCKTGIIDFIGGHSKYTVRRDPVTGIYFSVTNYVSKEAFPTRRNTLMLASSKDLIHWKIVANLLKDESGLEPEYSAILTGFQYPDWQFDGEDIIYIVRTAYRGAHTFHDSNRITYHVLKNFRNILK